MIVFQAIALERDRNLRINAGAAVALQVGAREKRESINPSVRMRGQIAATAIPIRDSGSKIDPSLTLPGVKADLNSCSRLAQHRVQHVRCNPTHASTTFPNESAESASAVRRLPAIQFLDRWPAAFAG